MQNAHSPLPLPNTFHPINGDYGQASTFFRQIVLRCAVISGCKEAALDEMGRFGTATSWARFTLNLRSKPREAEIDIKIRTLAFRHAARCLSDGETPKELLQLFNLGLNLPAASVRVATLNGLAQAAIAQKGLLLPPCLDADAHLEAGKLQQNLERLAVQPQQPEGVQIILQALRPAKSSAIAIGQTYPLPFIS